MSTLSFKPTDKSTPHNENQPSQHQYQPPASKNKGQPTPQTKYQNSRSQRIEGGRSAPPPVSFPPRPVDHPLADKGKSQFFDSFPPFRVGSLDKMTDLLS